MLGSRDANSDTLGISSVAKLLTVLLFGAFCASCGYTPTTGYAAESSYDTSIRSVNVLVFENRTFQNGLGPDITAAVANQIRTRTPWSVMDASNAQTSIRGTITDFELRRLSTVQGTGFVQEMAVEMTVDFDWRDNRTGEILKSMRNFRVVENFVPSTVSGERLRVGRNRAVAAMGEDIVRELRADW